MTIVRAKSRVAANRQKGYMLLAVMLLVTMMLLTLTIVLPRITQRIRREKEEELIHRGKEYAMAIKRYYHATPVSHGTYPTSLDQLESANHMRFLRKRFKDPMTVDGEWKLVHFGEAEIKLTPGGAPGAGAGGTGTLQTNPLGGSATPSPSPSASASPSTFGAGPGVSVGGGPSAGGPSAGGQLGSLQTTGSPVQGGGYIIGVASKSKEKSIKEFNGNSEYDEWLFVFDPRLECPVQTGPAPANPVPCSGNGIAIASPRSPTAPPINPPGPGPAVTPAPVPGITPPAGPGTSPTPPPAGGSPNPTP